MSHTVRTQSERYVLSLYPLYGFELGFPSFKW